MAKFNYNDAVLVKGANARDHGHERAWIVGVFEDRPGPYFDKFPKGVVYTIEFEDGTSVEVHENNLEADHPAAGTTPDEQSRYG